ncbi:transcriptional regulator with XRE-family HTH domain [Lactovum miscens]|uniref:Transcriptional regulator with XRE-family HTH domain n=2 Tax=Lactovum miscens TaxID=190387 RepID=A0A841C7U2_9LACT|nr:transcriptional regulator with XRE-family HTH domain [Lactovum miscens]
MSNETDPNIYLKKSIMNTNEENLKQISNNGLAGRIRQIREELQLTLEEFGRCVSPPATKSIIWNWENKFVTPNKKRLESIAMLGCTSVQYLLTGKNDLSKEIWFLQETDSLAGKAMVLYKEAYDEFNKSFINTLEVIGLISERSKDESEISDHEIYTLQDNLTLYKQINHNIFQIICPRKEHNRSVLLAYAEELRNNIEELIKANDSPVL